MKHFRAGENTTVCESHQEYGREWRNKSGYILSFTKKMVSMQMDDCVIHVPRKKVVVS